MDKFVWKKNLVGGLSPPRGGALPSPTIRPTQ